ncbi:unnamed protein product, partial [Sphacelaria rigidula]
SNRRLCAALTVCGSMSSKPRASATTVVHEEDPYAEFCRLAKQFRELRSIVRSTPKSQHRESGPPCTIDVTPSLSQQATSILSNGVNSPEVKTGTEVTAPAAAHLDKYSDEPQALESDSRTTGDSQQRNSKFASSNSPNQPRSSPQQWRAQRRSAIYCSARVSGAMTACGPPRNSKNDSDRTTPLLRPEGTSAPGRRRCRRQQKNSRNTSQRVSHVNRVHRGDGDGEGGLGRGKVDAMTSLNLKTAMAIAFDLDRKGRGGRGLSASAVRNICRERRIKQQQDAIKHKQTQHRDARAKALHDIHEFLRKPK